jgi:hypothetical protein
MAAIHHRRRGSRHAAGGPRREEAADAARRVRRLMARGLTMRPVSGEFLARTHDDIATAVSIPANCPTMPGPG